MLSRKTSASTRKVAVLDQSNAEAVMMRPPLTKPLGLMRVKGHGPAMHEARALRKTLPGPASRVTDPVDAFQYPLGEHGDCWLHGTSPWLTTWKVFTALPMFESVCTLAVYLF